MFLLEQNDPEVEFGVRFAASSNHSRSYRPTGYYCCPDLRPAYPDLGVQKLEETQEEKTCVIPS